MDPEIQFVSTSKYVSEVSKPIAEGMDPEMELL